MLSLFMNRDASIGRTHLVRGGEKWLRAGLLIVALALLLCPPVFSGEGGTSQTKAGEKLQEDLLSVSFPSEQQGWACGRWGTILHTDNGGGTWRSQESGTDYTLNSIFFLNKDRGWAVGDGGTIVSTTDGGKKWVKEKVPVKYFLTGVHFVNARQGWIVTEKTHILNTIDGGKTWTIGFEDGDFILKGVSFSDERNGFAVGEYGLIYHTTDGGKTWEKQAGGLGFSEETGEILGGSILFDVHAISAKSAWVAGIDGYVAKTEDAGKTWRQATAGVPNRHIFSIKGDKAKTLLIGGKGVVLFSTDQGQSWHSAKFEPSIQYSWIYKLTSLGNGKYVAVGANGAIYVSADAGPQGVWQKRN